MTAIPTTHNSHTPAEKGAIQELKEWDDNVHIASRQGSVVVVDKVDYLEETSDGRKILQKTGL